MKKESVFLKQVLPLVLTIVIFIVLSLCVYVEVLILNKYTAVDIVKSVRWSDIAVGMTIYLKTSVDFAIFIGNLMASYPGWKNRVAIETGTAAGNALGTIIVLGIWNFFRDIEWLLAIMIFIAALVLVKLAEDGLDHAVEDKSYFKGGFRAFILQLQKGLQLFNRITGKFLKYLIPHTSMKSKKNLTFLGLLAMSFTIPFILGLDDFAGYVPVFNIVNVLGFSIGVLAGHMILNIFLFISPNRTITIVKNPIISLAGAIAFIGLAGWGIYEVVKLLFLHN
jgi:hypothetical protein